MSIAEDHSYWMGLADDQGKGRDDCTPIFTMRAVQNSHRSKMEGHPCFEDVPYVKILIPGDNKNIVERKVSDADRQRWPRQWADFLRKRETVTDGTPLEQWSYLSVSQVAMLKALNVFTVEQVANASDTALQKIGLGAHEMQKRARQFLKPQSETETDLRRELAETQAERDALKTRVGTLERKLAEMDEDASTAPKRRKKADEETA